MKKTFKLAAAATMLATPAVADTIPVPYNTLNSNMENPLYMPGKHVFYSKLSNGVMLKVADGSAAHKDKHHDGEIEFPIIRIQEEMGIGITDRWSLHGSVQYTHDDDIGRTGLSAGRFGTTYRILNLYNGFVWDVYGDLHLGGLGEMRGQYNIQGMALSDDDVNAIKGQVVGGYITAGQDITNAEVQKKIADTVSEKAAGLSLMNAHGVIDYDNYSNGMWGYHIGTKVGKVWDKLTTSAFVEVLRTFGDDNSRIRLVGTNTPVVSGNSTALMMAAAGAPAEIAAKFKSTTEVNAGANIFYQLTSKWSTGTWFRYEHHADQGIDKITTKVSPTLEPVKKALEKKLSNMHDGFDDYIIGLSLAHQFTDHAQVALFGEYTFDTAHERSQNGTDAKVEAGVRVNFKF